jgi:outer membrane cobalamin receptor
VDRSVIQGVELGVDASPIASRPTFDVALSGTYLMTEDLDTGEELNYRPEYSGFVELRYRHDFGDGAFALTPSVSGSFVGRQQYDYTDPVTYLTSKRWLPAYALLGARVAFKAYYPEVFVAVKNLADEEYQTIYDYPMPGRTVSAGVALDF